MASTSAAAATSTATAAAEQQERPDDARQQRPRPSRQQQQQRNRRRSSTSTGGGLTVSQTSQTLQTSQRAEVESAIREVESVRRRLSGVLNDRDDRERREDGTASFLALVSNTRDVSPQEVQAGIRSLCRLSHVFRSALQQQQQQQQQNDDDDDDNEGDDEDDETETSASAVLFTRRVQAAAAVLRRCMEAMYYLDQALCTMNLSVGALRGLRHRRADAVLDTEDDEQEEGRTSSASFALAAGVSRFVGIDPDAKVSPVQQLILYILDVMYANGYSRVGGDCYRRLFTQPRGGYDTRAWTHVCTIKDLIYEATRKELKYDQWLNLTSNRSNVQTVMDYLTNCSDSQFPAINKDRHVFSFRNGIYVTDASKVKVKRRPPPHRSSSTIDDGDEEEEANEEAREARRGLRDAFIPYGSREYEELPSELAAAKFFDSTFPAHLMMETSTTSDEETDDEDWYHTIPTPHLQGILDFQRFDDQVCRWMYVMIGRLLYALGEYDGWQVVPYLKGQASSGKSTIVRMCANIYDACDVGVLSNNVERKFGIAALSDKYLFVAPEIKSDLQLEQAEFQSMVSGEPLQLAVKFQRARPVEWRVPGIMGGNEVPGWVDNSGSIGRRIVVFDFMRKVVNGDTELAAKLNREMPCILLKANRAYQQAVRRCGADNVWTHLPEYFSRMTEELTEASNPIQHFMRSGKLSYDDPEAYIPMDTLKRAFQAHCDENNFRKVALTRDKFEPVMVELGLVLERSRQGITRPYPRATPTGVPTGTTSVTKKEWCIGADLVASSSHQYGGNGDSSAPAHGDHINIFEDPMIQ